MAKKVDELGIEVDEDVAAALEDPKGGLLMRFVDYAIIRKEYLKKKEEAEKLPVKKSGVFGGLFE